MAEPRRLSFDPIAEAERQWGLHGWTDQAPGMALVTSIMRLQQIFLSRADAVLRPLGLTFARYEVLMLLSFSRRGTLPLGKIGERLQVNAASVTNAVDRLEGDGLVDAPVESGRRAGHVGLPDGGGTAERLGGHGCHERAGLHGPRRVCADGRAAV